MTRAVGLVRWLFLSLPGILVLFGTGCLSPEQQTASIRQRSVQALWDALQRNYPYIEIRTSLNPLKDRVQEMVKTARTRREYVVALAWGLSRLSDAHMHFLNLNEWWKEKEGTTLQPACGFFPAGGYHWIVFSPEQIVTRKGAPPLQSAYQLLSVEGLPAGLLAFELLQAEPGHVIPVSVVAMDGTEYSFGLRVPQVPHSAPASQPNSQANTIQAPPKVSPDTELSLLLSSILNGDKDSVVSARDGSIGYVSLGAMNSKQTVVAFNKALDDLFETNALVLDLRWSPGGNTGVLECILGRFVSGVAPYARLETRSRGYLIGSELPIWYSYPQLVVSEGKTYHKPIVVLIGQQTQSAAEVLAFALQDLRGATLVGCRTAGAGAAVDRLQLPDGLALQFGAMPIRRLDGRTYQCIGVPPDTKVEICRSAVCRDGIAELMRYCLETQRKGIQIAGTLASRWGNPATSQPATRPTE